jgi:hypothetical protein
MNEFQMTQISQDRISRLRAEADRSRLAAHGRDRQARAPGWVLALPRFGGRFSLARIIRRTAV